MPSPLILRAKRFYQRLTDYPGLASDERTVIQLIQLYLLTCAALSVLCGAVFASVGDWIIAGLCAIGIGIQSLELWLLRQRQYALVRHLFASLFPVYTLVSVILTGNFDLVAVLMLPYVTLSMFLFRKPKHRLYYVIGYSVTVLVCLILDRTVEPMFPVVYPQEARTFAYVLSFALEVFFINLFIGEMRRNSLALVQSERKYHTLFEKAPFPLMLYADGGIQNCNEAALRIMGAENKSDLIGRQPSDFSPELQRDGRRTAEAREGIDESIRSKGIHTFEWTHRNLLGREFPVEITMAAIQDNLMFGIWHDLSDRKEDEARIARLLESVQARKNALELAMEELQQQRKFYEDILNGLPADIVVFDKEHRYLFLNPVAESNPDLRRWLIGRTNREYAEREGLSNHWIRKRHALFQRVLHSGHNLHWEDRKTVDGKTRVYLRRLSPVYVNGVVQFVVGYGAEITKIKEAEALIRNNNTLLQAQVEERTRELSQTNRELQRSNADLESFAHAASHDLQEPLRMITSFLQMIRKSQGERLDEDGKEYISFALSGVNRLTNLIKALLTYAKLDHEAFHCRQSDIDALVRDRLSDLSTLIEERNANILLRQLPEAIVCEPVMLGMVFYNIIGNAIKFNRSEKPEVEIWCEESDEAVCFAIRDNGIGIPPEKASQIFEPFKRLHSSQEFAGTGVGLASCRKIVERHGGDIQVESAPGQGTTFRFSIPRQVPANAIRQKPSLPPEKNDASAPSSSLSSPPVSSRPRD